VTTDLVQQPRQSDDWVPMVEPLIALSERLAMTAYAGPMRGKPAEVFATVLYGRELGLSPAQALQLIHVVQGRPTLSAEGHRALFLSSGHRLDIVDWTDKLCSVRATRGDGRGMVEVTFTLKQATDAGLLKNPSWRAWPQQMLLARATSMAIKAIAPDVSLGLDAQDAPMEPQPAPAAGVTVVALQVEPEPVPVVEPEPVAEPEPEPVPLISVPQMRKLRALLRDLTNATGRPMDPDAAREHISSLAGRALASAKDLTSDEASRVIDLLTEQVALEEASAVVDAVIVEEDPAQ
jgi:hypothetical protein